MKSMGFQINWEDQLAGIYDGVRQSVTSPKVMTELDTIKFPMIPTRKVDRGNPINWGQNASLGFLAYLGSYHLANWFGPWKI